MRLNRLKIRKKFWAFTTKAIKLLIINNLIAFEENLDLACVTEMVLIPLAK